MTLFVVDDETLISSAELSVTSFKSYLNEYPKLGEPAIRVVNLCDTERYLSGGYYCSLLAEARQHQVLPTLKVINSLRENQGNLWLPLAERARHYFADNPCEDFVVCMGQAQQPQQQTIATEVFGHYPAPLLTVNITVDNAGVRVKIGRISLAELSEDQRSFALAVLAEHANKGWNKRRKSKKYRWDLAMLVDPDEAVGPSNANALKRFVKAGEKLGIQVHPVTAQDINPLSQFDGLFIRETTAIDHHTYRLACAAEAQDMAVIDDPTSILRCCNKVFLHDAFNYRQVPSLKTLIIAALDDATVAQLEADFGYPMVIKMPEGSFSRGVRKVQNRADLIDVAGEMLQGSALVLVQEYLFTEYDWRIGVLNGRALYACRYYMARNHWQIYNHGSKRFFSGGFDALPTFEVPRKVLDAALKAAAVVGDGLYGIDIKEVNGKAYVLEVNDNPSIDQGVEDKYLGKELYMQIMAEFLRRFELRGH